MAAPSAACKVLIAWGLSAGGKICPKGGQSKAGTSQLKEEMDAFSPTCLLIPQLETKIRCLGRSHSFLVFTKANYKGRILRRDHSPGNLYIFFPLGEPSTTDAGDGEIHLGEQIVQGKGVGCRWQKAFWGRSSGLTRSSSTSGFWHIFLSSLYTILRCLFLSRFWHRIFSSCANPVWPSSFRSSKCWCSSSRRIGCSGR